MKFSEFRQYRPKTVPNVVVFVCEDDFLVEESRSVWAEILGSNWRLEKLHAKDLDERDPGRLLDEAQTPSLFAQSRLLLIANAEKLSKRWGEELIALQDVSNSSLKVILLCTGAKALEDWMKKIPAIVIEPLKPGEVTRWLVERYSLSPDVARYVVESAGTELYLLHNEMEKLSTYLGGVRRPEISDVEVSVLHVDKFGAFELEDAILERDYRKAVKVVGAMIDDGVEPLLILAKIVRVWRQLFVGKGLAGKTSANEVAAAAGVPAFKSSTFLTSCRKYGWPQLTNGFRELLYADHAFKSSSPNVEAYFDILLWKLVA
jgi:DNA polymerase III subunit delta